MDEPVIQPLNMALEFLAMQLAANGQPGGPRWWAMKAAHKDQYRAMSEELIERWVCSEKEAEARATQLGLNLPKRDTSVIIQ